LDGHRESGVQPTPLGEATGTLGPDEWPSNVTLLQGDHTARFDWRVDLRNNTYIYNRLVEPVGPTDQRVGSEMAVKTTAFLNLQPIRLLRCWLDETIGSGGGHDRRSHAPREGTPWQGQTDSPVSHPNLWDRARVRPLCDTLVSVYDGGGESIPETPPNRNNERTKTSTYETNDERPIRSSTIQVEKLGQSTAATQSQDSVANLTTTH